MGFRDRGVEIKTPDQIAQDAGRGRAGRRDPRAAPRARARRASPPASSTRSPRRTSVTGGGVPSFLGYGHPPFPARSAPRSTTRWCTASRVTGPSQDGDVDLHRLRRDRRRLARRRGDHRGRRRGGRRRPRADAGHRGVDVGRHRRRPPRWPGHRHLARRRVLRALAAAPVGRPATASSRSSPATASGPRCTSRPTCPTTAVPGGGPSSSAGWPWPWSRWSRSAAGTPSSTTDEWTVVTDDGSWAAHFEHTFTLTPDGAWVLTALDGGQAKLAELGVPYGGEHETAVPAALDPGRAGRRRRTSTTSFLRFTGLPEAELPAGEPGRRRAASALDLDEWSGILLGGGPWNASDARETKSAAQRALRDGDPAPARRRRRARLPVPRRLLRHRHPRAAPGRPWSTAAGPSRSVRCR